MADKKISTLTGASTPLAGTEVLPIVQSGATVKVAVSDLTAGRAISATQITLSTGNVIVANGQGIDFSATPGTGTSELFADYEEGTWTPGRGAAVTVVGTFSSSGYYTKVGRTVTVSGVIAGSTSISFTSGGEVVTGLPFASNAASLGLFADSGYSGISGARTITSALYSIGIGSTAANIVFSITYQV